MVAPAGVVEPTEGIDALGPILSLYADETQRALTRDGRPAKRVQVSPTPVVWDSCCDGMVYSRLVSLQPQTGTNPTGGSPGQPGPCGVTFWTVNMAVGILRCAATLSKNGNPPSAQRITEDGLLQSRDLQTAKDAILGLEQTRAISMWTPLAPQGGCFGGEWLFNVRMENNLVEVTG